MKKMVVRRLFRMFLIRYIYLSGLKELVIAFPRVKHGYRILRCVYTLTFVEWLSQTTARIAKCPLSIDMQLSKPS